MLNSFVSLLTCEVCGSDMILDYNGSIDFYKDYIVIDSKDVLKTLDAIMADVIVYKCASCRHTSKHSFSDIETKVRKKLFEKLIMYYGRDLLSKTSSIDNKYLIYCGKCQGFDGHGSCPKDVFNKCDIKRFPNGL